MKPNFKLRLVCGRISGLVYVGVLYYMCVYASCARTLSLPLPPSLPPSLFHSLSFSLYLSLSPPPSLPLPLPLPPSLPPPSLPPSLSLNNQAIASLEEKVQELREELRVEKSRHSRESARLRKKADEEKEMVMRMQEATVSGCLK